MPQLKAFVRGIAYNRALKENAGIAENLTKNRKNEVNGELIRG